MRVEPFSVNRRLAVTYIENCLQALIAIANKYLCGRLASLKVAGATVILSLLTTFPQYKGLGDRLINDPVIQALSVKFQNPLAPIPPNLKDMRRYNGPASQIYDVPWSHNDKLELRLTVPILGWLSHTGIWTVVVWNHLSAIGVFYLIASLTRKALDDDVGSALFVMGIGPTFFGAWFFNDTHFGDGVAFFFLLVTIASGNLLISTGCFIAAAFCDERCVIAAPLLLLYFMVSLRQDTEKRLLLRRCMGILLGVVVWWLLRLWVARTFHLTMGTTLLATRDILRYHLINAFPYFFFNIFKTTWTLPLLAFITLISLRKWLISSIFAGAFLFAFAPALMVFDFQRCTCYTFIILLVSVHFLWGEKDASRKYLAGILLVNILLISPGTSILRLL